MKTITIYLKGDQWFARINDGRGTHEFFTGFDVNTPSYDLVDRYQLINKDYDIYLVEQIVVKRILSNWHCKGIGIINFLVPQLSGEPQRVIQFKNNFIPTPFYKIHDSAFVIAQFEKYNPNEKIILIK